MDPKRLNGAKLSAPGIGFRVLVTREFPHGTPESTTSSRHSIPEAPGSIDMDVDESDNVKTRSEKSPLAYLEENAERAQIPSRTFPRPNSSPVREPWKFLGAPSASKRYEAVAISNSESVSTNLPPPPPPHYPPNLAKGAPTPMYSPVRGGADDDPRERARARIRRRAAPVGDGLGGLESTEPPPLTSPGSDAPETPRKPVAAPAVQPTHVSWSLGGRDRVSGGVLEAKEPEGAMGAAFRSSLSRRAERMARSEEGQPLRPRSLPPSVSRLGQIDASSRGSSAVLFGPAFATPALAGSSEASNSSDSDASVDSVDGASPSKADAALSSPGSHSQSSGPGLPRRLAAEIARELGRPPASASRHSFSSSFSYGRQKPSKSRSDSHGGSSGPRVSSGSNRSSRQQKHSSELQEMLRQDLDDEEAEEEERQETSYDWVARADFHADAPVSKPPKTRQVVDEEESDGGVVQLSEEEKERRRIQKEELLHGRSVPSSSRRSSIGVPSMPRKPPSSSPLLPSNGPRRASIAGGERNAPPRPTSVRRQTEDSRRSKARRATIALGPAAALSTGLTGKRLVGDDDDFHDGDYDVLAVAHPKSKMGQALEGLGTPRKPSRATDGDGDVEVEVVRTRVGGASALGTSPLAKSEEGFRELMKKLDSTAKRIIDSDTRPRGRSTAAAAEDDNADDGNSSPSRQRRSHSLEPQIRPKRAPPKPPRRRSVGAVPSISPQGPSAAAWIAEARAKSKSRSNTPTSLDNQTTSPLKETRHSPASPAPPPEDAFLFSPTANLRSPLRNPIEEAEAQMAARERLRAAAALAKQSSPVDADDGSESRAAAQDSSSDRGGLRGVDVVDAAFGKDENKEAEGSTVSGSANESTMAVAMAVSATPPKHGESSSADDDDNDNDDWVARCMGGLSQTEATLWLRAASTQVDELQTDTGRLQSEAVSARQALNHLETGDALAGVAVADLYAAESAAAESRARAHRSPETESGQTEALEAAEDAWRATEEAIRQGTEAIVHRLAGLRRGYALAAPGLRRRAEAAAQEAKRLDESTDRVRETVTALRTKAIQETRVIVTFVQGTPNPSLIGFKEDSTKKKSYFEEDSAKKKSYFEEESPKKSSFEVDSSKKKSNFEGVSPNESAEKSSSKPSSPNRKEEEVQAMLAADGEEGYSSGIFGVRQGVSDARLAAGEAPSVAEVLLAADVARDPARCLRVATRAAVHVARLWDRMGIWAPGMFGEGAPGPTTPAARAAARMAAEAEARAETAVQGRAALQRVRAATEQAIRMERERRSASSNSDSKEPVVAGAREALERVRENIQAAKARQIELQKHVADRVLQVEQVTELGALKEYVFTSWKQTRPPDLVRVRFLAQTVREAQCTLPLYRKWKAMRDDLYRLKDLSPPPSPSPSTPPAPENESTDNDSSPKVLPVLSPLVTTSSLRAAMSEEAQRRTPSSSSSPSSKRRPKRAWKLQGAPPPREAVPRPLQWDASVSQNHDTDSAVSLQAVNRFLSDGEPLEMPLSFSLRDAGRAPALSWEQVGTHAGGKLPAVHSRSGSNARRSSLGAFSPSKTAEPITEPAKQEAVLRAQQLSDRLSKHLGNHTNTDIPLLDVHSQRQ